MKNNIKLHSGFTLVEILVSISIFSIIMVVVTSIYVSMTGISLKSDINRSMQENTKNLIEKISDDIKNRGISGVSQDLLTYTSVSSFTQMYHSGSLLDLGGNKYYLAKKDISGTWTRVDDFSNCDDYEETCYVYLNGPAISGPVTNSSISVESLEFRVSKDYVNKATMIITFRPASRRGVKYDLIKNNILVFQTTISERPLR